MNPAHATAHCPARGAASQRPEGHWSARWVWSHEPAVARTRPLGAAAATLAPAWALLRREFELPAADARGHADAQGGWPLRHAPARVAADSRYVLHVNGSEVARGPARSNLRRLHHDRLDLAEHLRPGRNCLAIQARFFTGANSVRAPVPPAGGLGGGAVAFEMLAGSVHIATDVQWRALRARAWQELEIDGVRAIPGEACEARWLPVGWTRPGFDDAHWPRAVGLRADAMGASGDFRPPSHPLQRAAGVPDPPAGPAAGRATKCARGGRCRGDFHVRRCHRVRRTEED